MTDLKKFLLFLSQFDYTYSKFQQIINFMGEELSIKKFCKTKFDDKILSKDQHEAMISVADEQMVENYYTNLKNREIILLTKFDNEYPERLRQLTDAPFFLFCRGDISLLNSKSLSVVGTRKPTNYGRMVTDRLVRDVASNGITIVSGLAYGIDSIAHRKCLDVGGKTIAVLGSGLNYIYPSEHVSLAEEITKKGLLISEYPPNKRATKYTFPQRNRIIAGLGDGVLITEAGLKSGTIRTKEFALDYGRKIYAVPGNIDSEYSSLTNDIVKTGQADLVTMPSDILNDYVIEKRASEGKKLVLSKEEQIIVDLLSKGIKDIDTLSKESGLNINTLNSYLTTLEIRGIICRLLGNFISLV